MTVSRTAYLNALRRQVSGTEREALENGSLRFISRYNRETMLRMLHMDAPTAGAADKDAAEALRQALTAYLSEYMPDCPQGHKWIILSCLFLAVVVGEPLHPQQATGWQKREDGYECAAREDTEGSICRWCVCRGTERSPAEPVRLLNAGP